MTPAAIAAMPAGPDKAEVMAFHRFLTHHPRPIPGNTGGATCKCGVPARLLPDGSVEAVANRKCSCPCHEPGYAVGR